MYKVIIVNGKPGSGKTTFEKMSTEHAFKDTEFHLISSVDYVKDCARRIGWNGKKDPSGRLFLSQLKEIMGDYNDSPFQKVAKKILRVKDSKKKHIFFIDVREPNEIARYVKEFNARTVLIRRGESDKLVTSNSSDCFVEDYEYDFIIENNGDLAQLRESAESLTEYFCL